MSERFLPKQRIRQPHEIAQILKQGKRISAGCFLFLYLKNQKNYSFSRLGMIIAKKYCKLAVARNRLKRLIREQFRHHASKWTGFDVVVMLRSPVAEQSDETQQLWLKKSFKSQPNLSA